MSYAETEKKQESKSVTGSLPVLHGECLTEGSGGGGHNAPGQPRSAQKQLCCSKLRTWWPLSHFICQQKPLDKHGISVREVNGGPATQTCDLTFDL